MGIPWVGVIGNGIGNGMGNIWEIFGKWLPSMAAEVLLESILYYTGEFPLGTPWLPSMAAGFLLEPILYSAEGVTSI